MATSIFQLKQIISALAILLATNILAAESTNSLPLLTLADAQTVALQNHPQIAAANYRALAAREVVIETRSGFFPNLTAYADVVGAETEDARILAGGVNNPSIYDRAAGGLVLNQLLFDFGRTANLTASSKLQARAEDENASTTREQVLLSVNTGYFNVLAAQTVLQVARQTVATRQLLLDQVSVLASNELRSEMDVSFARVALQQGRLLVQQAQNNADNAMTTLSTALGYPTPRQFQLTDSTQTNFANPSDVAQLVETALASRPELLSLRDEHEAALKFARSQRDARLPLISAVGMIGDSPSHDPHVPDNYTVGGIQLSLPIFEGGLYVARQHEAELKAQSENELVRSLEDDIVRDVHIAWQNVNNALDQLHTTEQLIRSANEAYELAGARYQSGSSSIVELSQAQLSLTSAQIAAASARYNVLIQQSNLAYQTGALR